jgi:hypothetical protein
MVTVVSQSVMVTTNISYWRTTMATNPVYLRINLTEGGTIDSVETADGTLIPISDESLIKIPLDLGDWQLGEFKTIVLVKLIAPDGSYTWMVKPSSGDPIEFCPPGTLCRRFVPPEYLWIKPEQKY